MPNPPQPSWPWVGGIISLFKHNWEKVIPDKWVSSIVNHGYCIEFSVTPPTLGVMRSTPVPFDRSKRQALEAEILGLLNVCGSSSSVSQPHSFLVIPTLSRDMGATSIDLKDAYLHIPIHRDLQTYLSFCYQEKDYSFRALLFGLATAPRVFTTVTRSALAFL